MCVWCPSPCFNTLLWLIFILLDNRMATPACFLGGISFSNSLYWRNVYLDAVLCFLYIVEGQTLFLLSFFYSLPFYWTIVTIDIKRHQWPLFINFSYWLLVVSEIWNNLGNRYDVSIPGCRRESEREAGAINRRRWIQGSIDLQKIMHTCQLHCRCYQLPLSLSNVAVCRGE